MVGRTFSGPLVPRLKWSLDKGGTTPPSLPLGVCAGLGFQPPEAKGQRSGFFVCSGTHFRVFFFIPPPIQATQPSFSSHGVGMKEWNCLHSPRKHH